MKFRNYLETITGIGIFPLISLVIFFVFFTGLILYVISLDKKTVEKMRQIPFGDGSMLRIALPFILGLFSLSAHAQAEGEPVRAISGGDLILYVVLAVLVFIGVLVIKLLFDTVAILRNSFPATHGQESNAFLSKNWWKHFRGLGVSLQDEKNILIEGHDYDGIQELDNNMPPWLQSLFLATIGIAIVYCVYYFGGFGDFQQAELDNEIAAAEIAHKEYIAKVGASMDENNVTKVVAEADLNQGKTIFQEKCTACHGPDGGGSVGPNLTDAYWLHGGSINHLFKVIKYGVPEKGMISWEKQLSPTDIQKVASYVLSLQGTKPASPKEPQGELFEQKENDAAKPVALAE